MPSNDSNSTRSPTAAAGGCFYGFVSDNYYAAVGTAIAVKFTLIDLFIKLQKIDLQDISTKKGDVAVITGGAAGIGLEVVKKLLKADFHVIMGVRNLERGRHTEDEIRKEKITSGKLEYLELELTSLNSVRTFSQMVLAKTNKIHLLINNAGIMAVPYKVTEDNMESQFQVNYLSHFLLTNLLLPTIIKTGADSDKCCRIINTSSSAQFGGNLNLDDLQGSKIYSPYKAYFDSKLAQVLSTKYLNRKMMEAESKVRIYSLHPGSIPTGLWDGSVSVLLKLTKPFSRLVSRTVKEGAETILFAALSPDIEDKGGIFLLNNQEYRSNRQADDINVQEKLWQISLDLAGLNY